MVNIKWSNKSNAQSAMQAYIRNIMMLIRNKVIANNGNLVRTKITWFYPNSMSPKRLSQLRMAWNDSYIELFNHDGATKDLSESVDADILPYCLSGNRNRIHCWFRK